MPSAASEEGVRLGRRCKLAHAFHRKHSYKRLHLTAKFWANLASFSLENGYLNRALVEQRT